MKSERRASGWMGLRVEEAVVKCTEVTGEGEGPNCPRHLEAAGCARDDAHGSIVWMHFSPDPLVRSPRV